MKKSFHNRVLVVSVLGWVTGMSSHVVAANATGTVSLAFGALDGGADEIQFGGSLTVLPNSLVGMYTGTFHATVDYQ